MHALRSIVIESDHRLRRRTGQLLPRLADIAPQRLDVLEHPCVVALLFLNALVKVVAHLPEAVVAARCGGRHHWAEMPDDVIKVMQQPAVLVELQPVLNHRVDLRNVLEFASLSIGKLDEPDEKRHAVNLP